MKQYNVVLDDAVTEYIEEITDSQNLSYNSVLKTLVLYALCRMPTEELIREANGRVHHYPKMSKDGKHLLVYDKITRCYR